MARESSRCRLRRLSFPHLLTFGLGAAWIPLFVCFPSPKQRMLRTERKLGWRVIHTPLATFSSSSPSLSSAPSRSSSSRTPLRRGGCKTTKTGVESDKRRLFSRASAQRASAAGGPMGLTGPARKCAALGSSSVATLILIRHGESTWNRDYDERFTGWFDAPLSTLGRREAVEAGNILRERGILSTVNVAFTSKLKRSYETLDLMMDENFTMQFPVSRSWRLNERHYGGLQGYNKNAVVGTLYDKEDVRKWRRSWDVPPPPMPDDHPHYRIIRRQYSDEEIAEMGGDIPRGESLEQTAHRLLPFWKDQIEPYVKEGKCILVVAHANSLRSLIGTVFDVPKAEIEKLRIPTGSPLVYNLDPDTSKPLPAPKECGMLDGELLWPLDECPVLFDEYVAAATLKRQKALEKEGLQSYLDMTHRDNKE
mmetsp:Transcript_16822/g.32853  ORF Transcript_16822/g.32853 Transcript_16822/m.32853 type:complete len:423 (+) Transcript_16822:97-1365(+)